MKKYPSGISYSLLGIIISVLVWPFIFAPFSSVGAVISLLVLLFVLHLFFTTYYVIKGDALHIKSGFLVDKTISISTISNIVETTSFMSAPAASFDRLAISYGLSSVVVVSPKDKLGFVNDILKENPEIEIRKKT